MLQFKVNIDRVTPILIKYFAPINWHWQDIDDSHCYLSYGYDDIGFTTEQEATTTLDKVRNLLSSLVTFNRNKVDLDPIYQEELTFLLLYIKEVMHTQSNEDALSYVYQDIVDNYVRAKAFIKQYRLQNPDASQNDTGLILEVRPSASQTQCATFSNLDVYYNFNHFLKAIEQQINIYIPEQIRTDLDNPTLSLTRIRELQRSKGISNINDHTKFLKAKATLMLKEYLRSIPPFNQADQESPQTGLNLTNDQIRLIYPLFHTMSWEEKPDKKEAYIKMFRKRVIHYYDKAINSIV